MRIKRYHVASATDATGLENEVGRLIAEGWQPIGHMVVAEPAEGSQERFFQAMVQYEGEIRS